MSSLAEDLPIEQARVRGLVATYHDLAREFGARVNVTFALAVCESALAEADKAVMSGDVVAMLRAYRALEELE